MFKVLKYRRDIMSNGKVQHEYQHDTCTSIIEAPNTLKGLLPVSSMQLTIELACTR